jgi:hypothetical protein
MTFWLSNRLLKQLASKAAGEKQPEAYPSHPPTPRCQSSSFPMGYVEDCFDLRTPLEGCFSSRQVVTC